MSARASSPVVLLAALALVAAAPRATALPQAGKPPSKPADAKPAEPKPAPEEPRPTVGLAELAKSVADKNAVAALGWLEFMNVGYKGAADHVGQGEAADAELALGGAVEKGVQALLPTLAGKKGKVRLNDAIEAPIVRVADDGLVVTTGKNEEKTVPWREVDPAKLAVLLVRNKPTADEEVATVSMLRLLA